MKNIFCQSREVRLCPEYMLSDLPKGYLSILHAGICRLRGLGWGDKACKCDYVFRHPYAWLVAYHWNVLREMESRGWQPDELWWCCGYQGKKMEMIEGEEEDELEKKVQSVYIKHCASGETIYPEHTKVYACEYATPIVDKGYDSLIPYTASA